MGTNSEIQKDIDSAMKDLPEECRGFLQVSGMTYEVDTHVKSTVIKDEEGIF